MTAPPRVPRLVLVTDASRAQLPLLDLVTRATAGGVDAVYLRDAGRSGDDLAMLVQTLRARTGDDVALLVNGGPEAALTTRSGLHLRERDMTPAAARSVLGPEALIGQSVHSPDSAITAAGADYVLAGHVYSSASKPGMAPLGLTGLANIVAVAPCPVIAIGGITPERVREVVQAGARGVAVIGAIAEADDPRAAARALRVAVDHALQHQQEKTSMTSDANAVSEHSAVEVIVNGKVAFVPPDATVHDFLASKRMTDAMAIVERNGEIVPRGNYGDTPLQAGDRLEVVHAVGGG